MQPRENHLTGPLPLIQPLDGARISSALTGLRIDPEHAQFAATHRAESGGPEHGSQNKPNSQTYSENTNPRNRIYSNPDQPLGQS